MSIWALADLHLAISCPEKDMAIFGPAWKNYMERIVENWRACVAPSDLVLLPGDITWALRAEDARIDLEWIDALPGTKIMIRGNHDLWWGSLKKVRELSPPSIIPLHHTSYEWEGVSIAGTRLWDSPEEYSFSQYIEWTSKEETSPLESEPREDPSQTEKIFNRELQRLELAGQALNQKAHTRIMLTHYPPVAATLGPSRASQILERYHVDWCLFGHLHNVRREPNLFGEMNGVRYRLCSADYLDFKPLKIV
jgi:uncharacterized protein